MKPIWVPSSSSCAQNISTDFGSGLTPSSSSLAATVCPAASAICTMHAKSPLASLGSGKFTSCLSVAAVRVQVNSFQHGCDAPTLFPSGPSSRARTDTWRHAVVRGIGQREFHLGFGARREQGVLSIKLNGVLAKGLGMKMPIACGVDRRRGWGRRIAQGKAGAQPLPED